MTLAVGRSHQCHNLQVYFANTERRQCNQTTQNEHTNARVDVLSVAFIRLLYFIRIL